MDVGQRGFVFNLHPCFGSAVGVLDDDAFTEDVADGEGTSRAIDAGFHIYGADV